MTDWLEASQVCFAQILEGRKSPKAFLAEDFHETYYDAVKHTQETDDWSKESLVKIIAPSFIQDATHQLHSLNGMGETTDWTKIMQDFAADYRLAQVYKKAARNLERGKSVDFLAISGHTQARVLKDSHGPTPLADIDCSNYEPFMPSGDDATDTILGGWPTDGPIIVYGLTGVGKSRWLASRMAKFLKYHKKKRGIVYTLEMGAKHWKWIMTKMYPYIKDVEDRFLVSGEIKGIEDLVAEVSAGQYDIVGIDDMDGLARENSAAEYESMYKKIKEICRFLHIPVIALCQPNRSAKLADRFLQKYDVAWSGAAENSAALLVALQIANELDLQDNQPFPAFDDDHEYEIIWKSRDGWPGDYPEKFPKGQFGPGAIIRKMVKGKKWEGEPLGRKIDEKTGEILSNGTLWRAYGKVAWKPKNKKKKEYDDG